jgi:hypothetical protein
VTISANAVLRDQEERREPVRWQDLREPSRRHSDDGGKRLEEPGAKVRLCFSEKSDGQFEYVGWDVRGEPIRVFERVA